MHNRCARVFATRASAQRSGLLRELDDVDAKVCAHNLELVELRIRIEAIVVERAHHLSRFESAQLWRRVGADTARTAKKKRSHHYPPRAAQRSNFLEEKDPKICKILQKNLLIF